MSCAYITEWYSVPLFFLLKSGTESGTLILGKPQKTCCFTRYKKCSTKCDLFHCSGGTHLLRMCTRNRTGAERGTRFENKDRFSILIPGDGIAPGRRSKTHAADRD